MTRKTETTDVGKPKSLSSAVQPVAALFCIFGFQLTTPKHGKKCQLITTYAFKIILRAVLLFCMYTSLKLNVTCAKMKVRKNFIVECRTVPFRINTGDLAFGFICFVAMNVYEKRLAHFFNVQIPQVFDQLNINNGASKVREIFLAVSVIVVIVTIFGAAVATSSLTSVMRLVTTLTRPGNALCKLFQQLCLQPIRSLSILYCGVYFVACAILQYCLSQFSNVRQTSPPTSEEYRSHYALIHCLLSSVNGIFNDVLPLLYVVNIYSITVWMSFLCNDDIDMAWEAFTINVLELLCIIGTPIVVNHQLKTLDTEIPIPESDSKIDVVKVHPTLKPFAHEVAIPEPDSKKNMVEIYPSSEEPPSPSTNSGITLSKPDSISQHLKLTAGNFPISSWIIAQFMVAVAVVSWMHCNFNWLHHELSKN